MPTERQTASYDRLNEAYTERSKAVPFDEYFGAMDLTDEEKEKRIRTAEMFEEMMLAYFALVEFSGIDDTNRDAITDFLVGRYRAEVLSLMFLDYQLEDYTQRFSENITRSTETHYDFEDESAIDSYWISEDRAIFVAENESNTIWEHADFVEALQQGRKYKHWKAFMDNKTRETHKVANGQKVPLLEPFHVGGYEMQYPKDDSLGADAKEIVNCRCTVRYSGSGEDYSDVLRAMGYGEVD